MSMDRVDRGQGGQTQAAAGAQDAARDGAAPVGGGPSAFSSAGPVPAVGAAGSQAPRGPSASELAFGDDEAAAEARVDAPAAQQPVRVRAQSLRVRSEPSTQGSRTLGTLARDQVVEARGLTGAWLQVLHGGSPAFIHGGYVEPVTTTETAMRGASASTQAAPASKGAEARSEDDQADEHDGSAGVLGQASQVLGRFLGLAATTVAEATTSTSTGTTLKGTALPSTTPEEAIVLNAIRLDDRCFDPAWLLAAQTKLGVINRTGAFNTETLRKMREFKPGATANDILAPSFLESLHKDPELTPLAGDADLATSTFKHGAKRARGNGADRAAQAVGYADYDAYEADWTNLTLCDKSLGRGHKYLASRLTLADAYLRQLNPGKSGQALRDAIGWSGEGNGAYHENEQSRAAGKTHVHTMGLAIDIDTKQNPWMLGVTVNDDADGNRWWIQYWSHVFAVACEVYGGEPISIKQLNVWSAELSTEELHAKVEAASSAFQELMQVARSGGKAGLQAALVASGKYDEKAARKEVAAGPGNGGLVNMASHWEGRFGRTSETKSFTNHSASMLVALRDVAGLAWGGSELADSENGDFMHFDCRGTGFGQAVYEAGRRNRGITE